MSVAYLVTCYNKSQYIADVLDAIIADRRSTDGDIIVIDDGSDDGSLDIIAARSTNQQNFWILRQDNAGVVSATNSLFSRCSQPTFRLIDGDDIISPGSTAALLNCLRRSGLDIVFGAHQVYEGQPARYRDLPARTSVMTTLRSHNGCDAGQFVFGIVYPLPNCLREIIVSAPGSVPHESRLHAFIAGRAAGSPHRACPGDREHRT